ncbi:hypothetical protein [Rhodoflexus caldus]|uniref:hypothetical protein n=1 Tax=Rhodoflexus caldus TaxID=2891236 RepID=UPI002029D5CE|nr:hypothetical protein [Rhodoflexus caldus]
MLQTVISNKYILAGWIDDGHVFYYTWKGFVPPHEMKILLDEVLIHLQTGNSSLMLQDLRTAQAVGTEVQEWLINDWVPRAVAIGLRKVALLTPQSLFGQLAVNQVRNKVIINGIELDNQFFDDEVKAIQWLRDGSKA